MYERTTLPNGLRVVTETIPHARSISVAVYLGAGSRYEDKSVMGISHFVEHMLFKGTEARPTAMDISSAIEGIGGVFNAEAGKEVTVYWAKVARPHFTRALDVLTDIILHSRFERDEIEKERQVIVEELNMIMDLPQDWVDLLIDQVLWGDQPLGWDVGGTKETVSRIDRQQLVDFVDQFYAPNNAVVSVAGAASHAEIVAEVEGLLGGWQQRKAATFVPSAGPQEGVHLAVEARSTEQAHLCLGVPALSYQDPDRFILDLANVILGEGMSSRLFQQIRERRGLAYDVHSYINHYKDAGSMIVCAGVDPDRIDQTIQAILEEIEGLIDAVGEEELSRAKEYWKGRVLLRLEDTRAYATWMGSQELLLGRIYTLEEVMEIVDAVSAADVRRVARQLFGCQPLRLAVVGPFNDRERFRRLIER
ncbi:MAG: insulinase family protein [Bacteroidetes bacterium]|nr:insulinase family protein [Bacteroidota bacterium]MCL5025428.1 insulinase family protein [Chloroflexota bacterium]